MGIVNVTPDSFFDGGEYVEDLSQRQRVDQLLSEGADILDIGAESTRPGAEAVEPDVQIARAEPALLHALRAGAMGYVNKGEETGVLMDAARRVLDGHIHLSPQMTTRLLNQVATTPLTDSRSPIEKLSDRELEVFRLIGEGLLTKQIAARLKLSIKTIETYRENIKAKLNLANAAELTRHAVQWVLEQS